MDCDPFAESTFYVFFMRYSFPFVISVSVIACYCVICRSTNAMWVYKWLLFANLVATVLIELSYNLMVIPVTYYPIPMGYPQGLLKYFPDLMSTHAASSLLHLFFGWLFVSIDTLFLYRWQAVLPGYHKLKIHRKKFYLPWVLALGTFFTIPGILMFFNTNTTFEIRDKVLKKFSCIHLPDVYRPQIVIYDVDQPMTKISMLVAMIEILVFAFLCGSKLCHSLWILRTTSFISSKARSIQYDMLIALVVQAFAPMILLFIPMIGIFYMMITEKFEHKFFVDWFLTILGLQGTCQSIVLMFLLKPYRRVLLAWIKWPIKTTARLSDTSFDLTRNI